MTRQTFALLIGINEYQSADIWNLRSAKKDARRVEQWLVHDLLVPPGHICTLLDSQATKRNIEDRFTSHLVHNPSIEPGDALIVYFAGHGSSLRAPPAWLKRGHGDVSVLCPYDYDTKIASGRFNAGISDESLDVMLRDLAEAKGDNITVILDTCFSLPSGHIDPLERRAIRFTPTRKAKPEDLLAGLWQGSTHSRKAPSEGSRGFTEVNHTSHTVVAACAAGWAAVEREDGGNFTSAFMALKDSRALHKLTYADLPLELRPYMGDHQDAVCSGANADRILFDGVPFASDNHFVAAAPHDEKHLRIDAGAMHGITVGTEFSLHAHNHKGSLNLPLGTFVVTEVFATWCLAEPDHSGKEAQRGGWAQVTRWNTETPFRVDVQPSFLSLRRRARLVRKLQSKPAVAISCARPSKAADLAVSLQSNGLTLERHDPLIVGTCAKEVHVPSAQTRTDLRIVEAAARFHMHLHRTNPAQPLANLVSMELYRLHPSTWTPIGPNLLHNGRAELVHKADAIYAIVLHNRSGVDLWPYLAYMDAGGYYNISMVYHPHVLSSSPPLRRRSQMIIGSGNTESDALSFSLADGINRGTGFLKLFVSTTPTSMALLEQGAVRRSFKQPFDDMTYFGKGCIARAGNTVWDTQLTSVTVARSMP
ncbi:hypothetical protein C8Q73DRAFT_72426 [Cubamyces lactineus]|nr:hypothetical protein C8Q73DRAFT_72426 [Cubamyces lactineus]